MADVVLEWLSDPGEGRTVAPHSFAASIVPEAELLELERNQPVLRRSSPEGPDAHAEHINANSFHGYPGAELAPSPLIDLLFV